MSVITIFSGIFCKKESVVHELVEDIGFKLVTDDNILDKASDLSGLPKNKIKTAFTSKSSVFNPFTHEKERSIACLKLAVALILQKENILISGFSSLLVPRQASRILRVCMTADTAFRKETAKLEQGVSEDEVALVIQADDADKSAWTHTLYSILDPWNPALYDLVLPMAKTLPDQACALIKEELHKTGLTQTPESKACSDDFLLAAQAGVVLANAGHNTGVEARNGSLLITINKKVLMLNRLEEELKSIAMQIPGVESVQTRVEAQDAEGHVYWKHSSESPSKVLLVDDEKEFVQTLSERLQMREMGCVVAFDGESALELVKNDDPEVMIIDLKMPGIDGMEVLTRVKQIRPAIEVIILTGHGSEQDKQTCLGMGAFAYMQKPIDINELSALLKAAHEKVQSGSKILL